MKIIEDFKESPTIQGLLNIKLDIFQDYRGEIWTIYSDEFTRYKFVQDKISISRFGVLRGFHGDSQTAKLITCLSGQFQLVVVDLRKNSKTYGNSEIFMLSDCEPRVVIVPEGCVNAHLCLSDQCIFFYKWTQGYRGPEAQITVAWNDLSINAPWMIACPIVSDRDKAGIPSEGVYL